MSNLRTVEICAGAGGQALGLHRAGFQHELAVELDHNAAETLRRNTGWKVAEGDVADPRVWDPTQFVGIDLLAGGVPCPPFSIAGKQLGSSDERDLFAWAVEQVSVIKPRALLLENVRGLAAPRFSAYRQRVLDRLAGFGYVADWRLLVSADFGVPQLRPRFVLVAMRPEDAAFFAWPDSPVERLTVGHALETLMGSRGWPYAQEWSRLAQGIGPTLVGGSKKHGGADLGPTRAKKAWAELAVDGRGIADSAPGPDSPAPWLVAPRLTLDMVARLQGWSADSNWEFTGGKTSRYRQIGNAFPPPVAEAVGRAIRRALEHAGRPHETQSLTTAVHDPVYKALSETDGFIDSHVLAGLLKQGSHRDDLQELLAVLQRDFDLETRESSGKLSYRLGQFRGFTGQAEHERHDFIASNRSRVS